MPLEIAAFPVLSAASKDDRLEPVCPEGKELERQVGRP